MSSNAGVKPERRRRTWLWGRCRCGDSWFLPLLVCEDGFLDHRVRELSAQSSPKDAPGSRGVSLSDATERRQHASHRSGCAGHAGAERVSRTLTDSPRRVAQIGTSRARGSFRPSGLSGEAARSRARYDGREQSGSEPFGGVMDRLTKSYPVFDCDAHINDPEQIWDYVPDSQKELVRNTYWRGDAEAWLNGDTPVMGGGNGALPRVQPDLHRRPADEQEDHAQAQHDAAHCGAEGVRAPRRRDRRPRPVGRDGPDGDRPGAGDPDDGDHARAVRDERRRSRRVLPGLQQLRRRLVQRGTESALRRRVPARPGRGGTRRRRSTAPRSSGCPSGSSARSTRRRSTRTRRRRR